MSIENLTLKEIGELTALFSNNQQGSHPFKVGENYLIRTVTMILIGRLESVHNTELVLSSAAWIPETDRWYNSLKEGKLKEIEPFINDVIIGRGSIIDATIWIKDLPRTQK